jgi:hypothetical protein
MAIGNSATMKCTISGTTMTCIDSTSDIIASDTSKISVDTSRILQSVSYPIIDVYGTEYAVGDNMTVWLQLLNTNRTPIVNATCFNKIWYPDKTPLNGYKTMVYLDEGIHYYDLTAGANYGVYPLSAKCYIPSIKDFSMTYKKDDGSAGSDKLMTGNWIYAHNFTYTNPSASNVDMCAWLRSVGSPTAYWTINKTSIQAVTGVTGTSQWVCNSITNISKFGFTGNAYFGLNCTNCIDGTRLYLGEDTDGSAEPNSYFHNSVSWQSDNNIYFIRLNVTDISSINETQYQVVMSSGEIHVSESLTNIQTAIDYIVTYGSLNLKANHNVCIDNTTLLHMLTYESCIGSRCFTYQKNETEICDFGCYTDTNWVSGCVPAPFFRYLWIIIIVIIIIIVFVIIYSLSSR